MRARLQWDDLDIAGFAERPLDPATLRVLEYMHDIEHHTVCYLRDLLATPAHADPDITAFLGFWVGDPLPRGAAGQSRGSLGGLINRWRAALP